MTFTPAVALLSLAPVLNERGTDVSTRAEYESRYRAARAKAARMDQAARRRLAEVYLEAAREAGAVVRTSLERGLSSLTVERWRALASELKAAADAVARGSETVARALVTQAAPLFPEIDADYLETMAAKAGAGGMVTRAGLARLVASTSSSVVASLSTRLWADGQTFSERVWGGEGVRGDWLERIRMTVAAGIAQGRDPAKIARDIQIYTADGKVALVQHWGGLARGTSKFSKRLPKNLDYRAVRLVRSELYASLQDASVLAGETNPGADGLYDWVLSLGRVSWPCECADLASGGPYKADELPTYPHPNCECWVRPHLRDRAEFLGDLKAWAKGGSVDYLDSWYSGPYKAAA